MDLFRRLTALRDRLKMTDEQRYKISRYAQAGAPIGASAVVLIAVQLLMPVVQDIREAAKAVADNSEAQAREQKLTRESVQLITEQVPQLKAALEDHARKLDDQKKMIERGMMEIAEHDERLYQLEKTVKRK
jgi:peptidoglycan hydrolase CwlO-like protein